MRQTLFVGWLLDLGRGAAAGFPPAGSLEKLIVLHNRLGKLGHGTLYPAAVEQSNASFSFKWGEHQIPWLAYELSLTQCYLQVVHILLQNLDLGGMRDRHLDRRVELQDRPRA